MKLTAKQRVLISSHEYDPIFMYTNPKTSEINFGLVRTKKTCLYITLSLRPLIKSGLVTRTDQEIKFDIPSYDCFCVTGYVIKINKP